MTDTRQPGYDAGYIAGFENLRVQILRMCSEAVLAQACNGNVSFSAEWTNGFDGALRAVHTCTRVMQPVEPDTLATDWSGLGRLRAQGLIEGELQRAMAKFPTWPEDPLHALAVLGEEFGELTQAMLQFVYEPQKTSRRQVTIEAVQCAAMAVRLVMGLEHYHYVPGLQYDQAAGERG